MKRKIMAMLLVLALCLSLVPAAMAADDAIRVNVTISAAGKLILASKSIDVTDADGDGVLTICDALAAAHDDSFEGGAKAGFATETTEYGLGITKLWGVENGGSYGYYVNNTSAFSLSDPIKADDDIYAFSYADLTGWSDAYTYFDLSTAYLQQNAELTLTLNKLGFDADWKVVTAPLAGATLTVDGQETDMKTDKDGHAILTFAEVGNHVVSAVFADATIVPPVCVAVVVTEGTLTSPEPKAPLFADVAESDWFHKAVVTAAEAGLVVGRGGKFDPQANMTVAEYLTILYRLGESYKMYEGCETTGANWQNGAKYLSETLGFEVKDYDAAILREEMAGFTAAFLKAYAGERTYVTKEASAFTDIADSAFAEDIAFMQSVGAIGGYTDGTFRPENTIRRCEVAQVICNLLSDIAFAG
ncbi:MAG: S-layer homology domain-containing protein [Clostridiaceae bacterium]|nr:S-layer homology domain-containing protein [Clostridiaceae bacterium]